MPLIRNARITVLLLVCLCGMSVSAQDAPMDLTFGDDGFVTNIVIPNYVQAIPDVVVPLADGRFFVAFSVLEGGDQDVAVVRFFSDGRLDPTFGTNGAAIVDWQTSNSEDKATGGMVIDSQGRIIVAGVSVNGTQRSWALARLTPAGMLDQSFSGDGKLLDTEPGNHARLTGIQVDNDDSIIVIGSAGDSGSTTYRLARVSAAGVVDEVFGLTFPDGAYGQLTKDNLGRFIASYVSIPQPLFVSTYRRIPNSLGADNSFDDNGVFTEELSSAPILEEVMVQSTNKIILAGYNPAGLIVWRYDDQGLDTSFGTNGRTPIIFAGNGPVNSAAIDNSNRVVLASDGTANSLVIARLTANGQLDTSFGGDGLVTVADLNTSGVDRAHDIAIMPDGDIIAVGYINSTGGLARLDLSDPTPLIANGGFETADAAQTSGALKWVGANLSNDKRNCTQVDAHSGKCSFIFRGSATEKAVISQTIKPAAAYRSAGTGLVLAAWVRGTPNTVLAKIVIYYTDGSRDSFSALFGPAAAYQYFTSAPFFLAKNAKQFKVSFRHFGNSDKLYLDDVGLLPNGARSTDLLPLPPQPSSIFRTLP